MKVLMVDLGSEREELNEPIGICSISSYVKKYFIGRIDIDLKFLPVSTFPTSKELSRYDVVGLSTKIKSLSKIDRIYELFCALPVGQRPVLVLGDLIATFATQQILERYKNVICVVGEGEVSFLNLLQIIDEEQATKIELPEILIKREVPNLAYSYRGRLIFSNRELVDTADCPPPERIFAKEISRVGGIIRVESSRGCAWGKCSFCAIQYKYCNDVKWRGLAIDRVVDELEELSSLGVGSPFFTDEDFVGDNPVRAIELAHAIINAKNQERISRSLNLYIDLRVDTILSCPRKDSPSGLELLRILKHAGLREIFVGLESGSGTQVSRYKKPSTNLKNRRALELVRSLGISLDIGFIMFDPEMNLQELKENVEFIYSVGLNTHDSRLTKQLRIEPGTPILSDYFDKNMISGDLDVDELTYPYRWKYPEVEDVFNVFDQWESVCLDEIYTIQAATRGEFEDERLRLKLRKTLGEIRAVEIDCLNYISSEALMRKKMCRSQLEAFQEKRISLVSDTLKRLRNYTNMYSRFDKQSNI